MRLPDRVAYAQAVQSPRTAFAHLTHPPLHKATVQLNALRMPSSANGAFAITFALTAGGHAYAVRCFTHHGKDLAQRYDAVARFVRTCGLDFLVEVDYFAEGITVAGERWPTVVMPWVDGLCLNDWIDDHLHEPEALHRVRQSIADAVAALRRHGAAHGDLQHGNILVRPDASVKLIDYDGMFVPDLIWFGPAEHGNRHYQHPLRWQQFDASLDSFAAHVIDLSLAATAADPELWLDFNVGDNLLFTAGDFADPAGSEVFARLEAMPRFAAAANRLRLACLSDPELADDVLSGAVTPEPATPSLPRVNRSAHPVIDAGDRSRLLAHEGAEVTVVGRAVSVTTLEGNAGRPISLINFGDQLSGAFTAVLWERTHADVLRQLGDPASLEGSHLSVTGRVSRHLRWGRTATPQIELRHAKLLRPLTAAEAKTMLHTGRPLPVARRQAVGFRRHRPL